MDKQIVDPIGDYLNSYMNDASIECFNKCIKDFKKEDFNKEEEACLINCFAKYFVSYSNMSNFLKN